MALAFAGMFGPHGIEFSDGAHARRVPVIVLVGLSGDTLATLYTSRAKSETIANPVATDQNGNLSFYAVPGHYRIKYANITLPIAVPVDPEDVINMDPNPEPATVTWDSVIEKPELLEKTVVGNRVYITDAVGDQQLLPWDLEENPVTFAVRDAEGRLKAAPASASDDVVVKSQLDSGVSSAVAVANKRSLGSMMSAHALIPEGAADLPTVTRELATFTTPNSVMWNSAAAANIVKGAYLEAFSGWGFNDSTDAGLPNQFFLEFWHTGQSLDIRLSPSASASGFYQIWVNNHPVTKRPVYETQATVGSAQYLKMAWAGPDRRLVRVLIGGYEMFHSINTPSTERVVGTSQAPLRGAIIGDSYIQANHNEINTPNVIRPMGIAQNLYLRTGFEWIAMGVGSTGYKAGEGTNIHFGSAARVNRMALLPPLDFIAVFGSSNDIAAGTSAQMAANATALFQALAIQRPGTPVIVFGPQGITISDAQWAEYSSALEAAALAAPNVIKFVDLQLPQKWLTGSSGSIAAPTGSGNRDIFIGGDGVHPSSEGSKEFARRMAEAISTVKI